MGIHIFHSTNTIQKSAKQYSTHKVYGSYKAHKTLHLQHQRSQKIFQRHICCSHPQWWPPPSRTMFHCHSFCTGNLSHCPLQWNMFLQHRTCKLLWQHLLWPSRQSHCNDLEHNLCNRLLEFFVVSDCRTCLVDTLGSGSIESLRPDFVGHLCSILWGNLCKCRHPVHR